MTDKKQFIQQQYNENDYVASYDIRYRPLQYAKLNLLKDALDPLTGIVLDDGTGTGLVWEWMNQERQEITLEPTKELNLNDDSENNNTASQSQHNMTIPQIIFPIRFIGIDISLQMLRCFRTKLDIQIKSKIKKPQKKRAQNEKKITAQDVQLICADAENLPFRDDSCNTILALTTLQNLPHLEKGLQEIQRVQRTQKLTSKSQVGISFLKKSLSLSTLESTIEANLGHPRFQNPPKDEFDRIIEIEDYVCVIK